MTDEEIETTLDELAFLPDFDRAHAVRVIAKQPCVIIMRTAIDAEGVEYEVIAGGGGVGLVHAFEQGEDEQGIWSRTVEFGAAEANRLAMDDQKVIADLLTDIVIATSKARVEPAAPPSPPENPSPPGSMTEPEAVVGDGRLPRGAEPVGEFDDHEP